MLPLLLGTESPNNTSYFIYYLPLPEVYLCDMVEEVSCLCSLTVSLSMQKSLFQVLLRIRPQVHSQYPLPPSSDLNGGRSRERVLVR